jgi:hypothetical protein
MRLDLLWRALLELLSSLPDACGALLVTASVGRLLQPRRRRRAVLGRSAVSTVPPPSPVQLLDDGLAATTEAAPSCRCPGLLPCSSGSTPVSFFFSS